MQVRSLRPRLRFIDPPANPQGGGTPPTPTPTPTPIPSPDPANPPAPTPTPTPSGDEPKQGEGYPAGVSWRDMKPEEQAAYWRFHARQHEREATDKERELAEYRQKNETAEQKRERELMEQGQALGAEPFIAQAVRAELRAATGRTPEQIDAALQFVDPNRFLVAGKIDDKLIADYAATLGASPAPGATPGTTPPASYLAGLAAQSAQRGGDAPPQGGSINDRRKEVRDRIAKQRGISQ